MMPDGTPEALPARGAGPTAGMGAHRARTADVAPGAAPAPLRAAPSTYPDGREPHPDGSRSTAAAPGSQPRPRTTRPGAARSTSRRPPRSSPTPSPRQPATGARIPRRWRSASRSWAPTTSSPGSPTSSPRSTSRRCSTTGRGWSPSWTRSAGATSARTHPAHCFPDLHRDDEGAHVGEATVSEDRVTVQVVNESSVPISVSSHFHFFEVNPRLRFDRAAGYGRRLDVPAGSTVAFAPGEPVEVALVPIGGARVVVGFAGSRRRPAGCARCPRSRPGQGARLRVRRLRHLRSGRPGGSGARRSRPRPGPRRTCRSCTRGGPAVSRGPWNDMAVHGPRLGDRVRLGDTGLTLEVMADDRLAGDELLLGFAKTGRDGIGFRAVRTTESCDVVVTNVLLLDPVLGVRVTSIGIREGRIVALGRSGNPDTTDGVDVVVGSGTIVIPGEGLIATPGAVDPHVHGLSPRVMEAALSSGRHEPARAGVRAVLGRGRRLGLGAAPGLRRVRRLADQRGGPGPRLVRAAGPAARGPRGRRVRVQGPRGHRCAPAHPRHGPGRGRGARRRGRPAHRRAQRGPVGRGHPGRAGRPGGPRVPRRGLRRRAHPQRPAAGRRGQRPGLLDQPDAALRRERPGRARVHDHGLPRAAPGDPRRPRPGPQPRARRHDGRREPAPRPRRDPHDQLGRAGHGPGGRDLAADLRAGVGHQGRRRRVRRRRGRCGGPRQRPGPALPRQAHDQPGPGARDRPRGGLPAGGTDGRHRALASRRTSPPSRSSC